MKETDRPLIPHTLTKRQEAKGPKPPGGPSQGLIGSSASPSAIKAAAKSAAMHVARQIATEEQDEEDMCPQNYFSLEESSQSRPAAVPSPEPEPGPPAETLPYSAAGEPGQSDAPLDFGGTQGAEGAWEGQYSQYEEPTAGSEQVWFYNFMQINNISMWN